MIVQVNHASDCLYHREWSNSEDNNEPFEKTLVLDPSKIVIFLHSLEKSDEFQAFFLQQYSGLVLKIHLTSPINSLIDFKS